LAILIARALALLHMKTSMSARLAGMVKSPTFATWSSFATKAASFVVLYPFVLRGYSQADIVFWLAVSLPGSMLTVVDAGMTPTAVRFFSYGLGGDGKAGQDGVDRGLWAIDAVVGTVRRIYLLLTLACFILAGGIALWIASNQASAVNYSAGWAIMVLSVTAYFWSFQHQAWLQASHRIAELRFRETKIQTAALVLTTILAVARVDILSIVVVNCGTLLVLVYLHRRSALQGVHGENWTGKVLFDRRIAGELYTSSWKSGIGIAMSYGLNQGLCAWYAATASATAAAQFLLTMRLLQVASQISQAPFYTKIPSMAGSYARRDLQAVVEISRIGIRRSIWVFVVLALGLLVVLPVLLPLIGSKTEIMPPLWMAVAMLAIALERCGGMLVQAYTVSNVVHWHWLNFLVAVFAVGVGALSWPAIGALAIPVAWAAAMLLIYIPVGHVLDKKLFGSAAARGLMAIWFPAVLVLIIFASASVFVGREF
jgi:O-antigen/teichoic acid export membrane protein